LEGNPVRRNPMRVMQVLMVLLAIATVVALVVSARM
jgi:hypothetical protein